DRGYVPGRSPAWQKSKCTRRQEFVIVGFTDPEGSRTGIGALLLGVQASEGLVYAGKVGTGFSARSLQVLHERLAPLQQDEPPLAVRPRDVPRKGVHWVRPRLVCEVAFTAWTHDGRLRHPSFVGLREDKDPRAVRCEEPAGGSAARARGASGSRRAANATDEVAGVRLTHPDRVMYPEQGLSKRALAEFYRDVADWILPEVVGRPLALVRCPEGRGTQCFFQKHAWPGMPEAIRRRRIGRGEDAEEVLFIEDRDGLL